MAAFVKKEFDKKHNPTWHCIVGRNFGSYVTHETKHFIYFYCGARLGLPLLTSCPAEPWLTQQCAAGQVAFLLFKSG